jgi:hypothetical protein
MTALGAKRAATLTPYRSLVVVLAALIVSLLGACRHGDECTYDESHCDGDVVMECIEVDSGNGPYKIWRETPCGAGTCQFDPARTMPFCALGTAPEPRCQGHSSFCDGAAVAQCRAGYVEWLHDCASEQAPRLCIMPDNDARGTGLVSAMCVAEPEPNPLCNRHPYDPDLDVCDGNDKVDCESGYVSTRRSCGERFCRSAGACVLSSEPDPRCPSNGNFCEGNTVVHCTSGYRTEVRPCDPGQPCEAYACEGDVCAWTRCSP